MAQLSLAWMLCKKPWIVPILEVVSYHVWRKTPEPAQVKLSESEVRRLDEMLDQIPMSAVFGGSKIVK